MRSRFQSPLPGLTGAVNSALTPQLRKTVRKEFLKILAGNLGSRSHRAMNRIRLNPDATRRKKGA